MTLSATPPTLEQVCEKALRLPCSPALLPRLATALLSDDSSAAEIERLISLDASLAAATLRLANSAMFARRQIDSLEEAILRLGAKEIYRLAALVLVNRWETGVSLGKRWEPGDYSRHALCTAIAAEALAEETGRVTPQVAYTAGLITDLGKLALAHGCGDFYDAVRSHCEKEGCTWEQAETAVLGYNHLDASVRLLRAWKFPENFALVAEFTLNPMAAPAQVMPLLSHLLAAQYLATALGPGVAEDGFLFTLHGGFLREWGFTQEIMDKTLPVVLERAAARLGSSLNQGAVKL
jgi:HD-like signal output (HDOD) protein